MNRPKKIITISLDIIIFIFLSVLILYIFSVVNFRRDKFAVPGVAGVSFLVVRSGSMEPAVKVGDLLAVKKPDISALKEGDIISYFNGSGELITHRIVKVDNGMFITRGDVNNVDDSSPVPAERIAGKLAVRIPYLGYVFGYAKTKIGIIVCLIIPSLIILCYALTMIVDEIHNSSKHHKKIMRKRRRRAERYKKDDLLKKRVLI